MSRCLGLLLALLAAVLPIRAAEAQQYPSKIIKLIIPYPAGGVVDVTGRLLAEHLRKELNGTIIVENKPGAGGTIGATFVARAEPDGYTLLLSGAATHAFRPCAVQISGLRSGGRLCAHHTSYRWASCALRFIDLGDQGFCAASLRI